MKKILNILSVSIFFFLSIIFIYPVLQGLILLPLDLLVSNYSPWHFAGTILLKNSFMQDSIMQMFPWRHLTYESLISGIIPFWNPYQFMGMPFMAAMKPMVFYPLNIFFSLGEIQSWHLLLLFQTTAASVFTYLFLRDCKQGRLPSILAGISFAFSSLMVGVMEFGSEGNVLLWYPLFLLVIKKNLDSKKPLYLVLFSFSVAFAVFAGHLQYLGYGCAVAVVFTVFYGRSLRVKMKSCIAIVAALFLGLGISAIQLIPSIEMFRYSYRGIADPYAVFSEGLLKPYQLIRLFAPDFFGHPMTRDLTKGYIEQSGYFGLIPLFFALYAMTRIKKNMFVKTFSAMFVLGILFSLDGIAQIIYFLKIPIFSSGYGGRIFAVSLFSGALLSSFGFAEFLKNNDRKKLLYSGIYIGIVGLIFGISILFKLTYFVHLKFPLVILFVLGILFVFYYVFLKRFSKIVVFLFSIGIIACSYGDLFRLGYRFLTFSNNKFLYPDTNVISFINNTTNKTLERMYGIAEPELSTYFRIYAVETYNPLYDLRTARLLQALNASDQNNLPINKFILDKKKELKHVFDVTGTSLIVVEKGENPSTKYFLTPDFEKDMTKIYDDEKFEVYRNTKALPRFGLFYKAKTGLSDTEILDDMKNCKTDLSNTLLLDGDVPIPLRVGTGSAVLVDSTINTQIFKVETSQPAFFYISDTYYPGWKAFVNNTESDIYRTNYNFRSVIIPEGISEVVFAYKPTNWNWYVAISIVSIIILIIFVFIPF